MNAVYLSAVLWNVQFRVTSLSVLPRDVIAGGCNVYVRARARVLEFVSTYDDMTVHTCVVLDVCSRLIVVPSHIRTDRSP